LLFGCGNCELYQSLGLSATFTRSKPWEGRGESEMDEDNEGEVDEVETNEGRDGGG